MPRSDPSSLRQNVSWAFVGNAVYAATQWLMLVSLAKLGTPTMVGQFALGLAVSAPVFIFTNLQLRSVLATDAGDSHGFGDYLGLRLTTAAVALVTVVAIALAGYRETALVIVLLGLAKAIEAQSDICYGWFQHLERLALMARSLILRGLLGLATMAGLLAAGAGMTWAVLGLAGAWAVVLLGHDLPAAARARPPTPAGTPSRPPWPPRLERARVVALIRLAWPLGLSMLFVSLNHNIPRYFVEHHLGEAGLGIFAAMAYLPVAGDIVIRALGQAATPRLARHHADGQQRAFDRLLARLLGLGLGLGLAGVALAAVAGGRILDFVFGPAYAAHADVFVWVMAAGALTYLGSLLNYASAATRAFSRFTAPYAAVTVVALVTSALLIPWADLRGAAWSLCAIGAATCAAPMSILIAVRLASRHSSRPTRRAP
ncbi:lipopolysaccharide biosynthesis protein [Haliangium sp.]|uniref:lipopolysaccharide biosynthesis protein n=1 Tax=Haliangium sp. TaxID=2663208 RepID=UPI003D12080B